MEYKDNDIIPGNMAPKGASSSGVAVLDFDGSVGPVENAGRLSLAHMYDEIWYSASLRSIGRLENALDKESAGDARLFFTGNGDFHHVSYALLKRLARFPIHLVVFDNHPDNMLFPFGIHCASWVYHASRLPDVKMVSVFGIAARDDLGGINTFQHHYGALRNGHLRYYCLTPVPGLSAFLGGNALIDLSARRANLAEIVKSAVADVGLPVYLSIDKDVLSPKVVRTSWDQGVMGEPELMECIDAIADGVIAADVTGELASGKFESPVVKSPNFKLRLKKILRRIDGKPGSFPDEEAQRIKHCEINAEIIKRLRKRLFFLG